MTYRHEQAVKDLQIQANRARDLANALDHYAKELEDDRKVALHTRYEWAINEIENYIRNINFASLARNTANLMTVVEGE